MAVLTSASFVALFSWIFVLCQGTQELKVTAGENATLQCRGHRGAAIEVIKWIRTDLKSDDGFVFYLNSDQTNGEYQNSLFQGRVELQDPEMKNGNASVILKNVTINDAGTYECWIAVKNSTRRKRAAPEPISTVKLSVIGTQEVTAGDNATLQCRGHRGAAIELIKWIRTDLKSDDGFVFYLNSDQTNGEYQNSLFQGRVELQDSEKKNGDASVILKDVTINDTGTYECWIAVNNSGRSKTAAPEPISTVKLTVIGTQELKVKAGEDATLQCRGHRGADIEVIRWIRADLKSDDGFVFYLREGHSFENIQHPSFRGRVELRDPEMKNGDASVILKNVNIDDTGTYECWIAERNSGRSKRDATELISTVKLTVTGGDKERNVGPMVGLPVFAVLLVAVAVVGTMIFKKRRGNTAHTGEQTESLKPTNIMLTDPGHTAGDEEGGGKEA